jgi:hypothetical protein
MTLAAARYVGVVIGASRFPKMPSVDSAELERPLREASKEIGNYLESFCECVLNLFDCELTPDAIINRIREVLEEERSCDVVVYYVGHGNFSRAQEYFLCLRATEIDVPETTGLSIERLAQSLRQLIKQRKRRFYFILDCCFAGAAAPAFMMSAVDDLRQKELVGKMPNGVALLCAASRDLAALTSRDGKMPLFSQALVDIVKLHGVRHTTHVSMRELLVGADLVLRTNYSGDKAPRPELYVSNPFAQNIGDLPVFPVPRREYGLDVAGTMNLPRIVVSSPVSRLMRRFTFAASVSIGVAVLVIAGFVVLRYEFLSCWWGRARGCTNYGVERRNALQFGAAVQYYHFGCVGGDPLGCTYLAAMYDQGRGVPQNHARAAAMFERACVVGGEEHACAEFGRLLIEGVGVQQDVPRGRTLIGLACSRGQPLGCDYQDKYEPKRGP